jgi:glucose/arabinose dehydrogenase
MFFHPVNGFLYVTNGDDERGANNQRINVSLHSGVLRIDVDQRGGSISHPIPRQPVNGTTANYYIPNDNPFVGQAGVLEEFFCIGLRSPHRMTYDPVSSRIFIGDVGQGAREEHYRGIAR